MLVKRRRKDVHYLVVKSWCKRWSEQPERRGRSNDCELKMVGTLVAVSSGRHDCEGMVLQDRLHFRLFASLHEKFSHFVVYTAHIRHTCLSPLSCITFSDFAEQCMVSTSNLPLEVE